MFAIFWDDNFVVTLHIYGIASKNFISISMGIVMLKHGCSCGCDDADDRSVSISQPLMKCKRVFQALINIAIEELCETANSLIAPVRLGVTRPTASFSLVSSNIDAVQVSLLNLKAFYCHPVSQWFTKPWWIYYILLQQEAIVVLCFIIFTMLV